MSAIPPTLIDRIRALTPDKRKTFVEGLPPKVCRALLHEWRLWARPEQIAPENFRIWLILAGRGFGKTRTGAEWVIDVARKNPKARIALVGSTAADVRDVMVGGESGILAKSPPDFTPTYEPSKRLLTWPNGARAHTFSAEEPRRIRGPQFTHAWADELAAWQYPEAWDQLRFTMRLGRDPRIVVTTTPTPTPLIRRLVADAEAERKSPGSTGVVLTRGKTQDNRANLAPSFLADIERVYAGTRLYRQEVLGEVLSDIQGALWVQDQIHTHRVVKAPSFRRIVIGVDPAVSTNVDSDLTGIVVCGVDDRGHGYVLEDLSGVYSPSEWAHAVKNAYERWEANTICAERNQGGDLVTANMRTVGPFLPIKTIHASKGKFARAEPIAALAQQGKIHHVGQLPELEKELTEYSPITARKSPDRLDAMVYALTELCLTGVTVRDTGGFIA